jgi:transposase
MKALDTLATISFKDVMDFFKAWLESNKTSAFLAYDVTSFSNYANDIKDSELGYIYNGKDIPQINLGCYFSYETRLPMFYVTYPGSIIDNSHLPHMMKYNEDLKIQDVVYVMDRGFSSSLNLPNLIKNPVPFIIALDSSDQMAL